MFCENIEKISRYIGISSDYLLGLDDHCSFSTAELDTLTSAVEQMNDFVCKVIAAASYSKERLINEENKAAISELLDEGFRTHRFSKEVLKTLKRDIDKLLPMEDFETVLDVACDLYAMCRTPEAYSSPDDYPIPYINERINKIKKRYKPWLN